MSSALILHGNKCWICGDAALGWNYSALSCKSCKIFFYRYVTKSQKFKCLNQENNCKIDMNTRSKCKKCRLDKCFSVGMEKMSMKADKISLPKEVSSLRSILELNSFDNMENFNFSKEISKFNKIERFPFVLSGYEIDQIARVQNVIDCAFDNEQNLHFLGYISNSDAINKLLWPDMYASKIVNFCKNIIEFKMLNKDDQLMVLRKFVLEILFVWMSFLWDSDMNGFLIIESSGKQSYMLQFDQNAGHHTFEGEDLCQQNIDFCSALNKQMENDVIIRDLLLAQLLFHPRDTKILNNEFIKYQYYLYTHLMKRYLMHKYRDIEAANRKFAEMMQLIEQLLMIKRNCELLFKEICINQLPELVCEIFV